MTNTSHKTVADSTLPLLVTLVQARKQARWQWRNCADEHKHSWAWVLYRLDERIAAGEYALAKTLDMCAFHIKREVVE